ncbi:MAG: hypothetical protein KJ600_03555 [Nanoarchaeota archaeon]|nr:hypothetical protein [Nanoarchaeota archaeon]MBU1103604.1 hypothetical protein [Nanoarchaeota archaeon]
MLPKTSPQKRDSIFNPGFQVKLPITASYEVSKIKKQSPSTTTHIIPSNSGLCDNVRAERRHGNNKKYNSFYIINQLNLEGAIPFSVSKHVSSW